MNLLQKLKDMNLLIRVSHDKYESKLNLDY